MGRLLYHGRPMIDTCSWQHSIYYNCRRLSCKTKGRGSVNMLDTRLPYRRFKKWYMTTHGTHTHGNGCGSARFLLLLFLFRFLCWLGYEIRSASYWLPSNNPGAPQRISVESGKRKEKETARMTGTMLCTRHGGNHPSFQLPSRKEEARSNRYNRWPRHYSFLMWRTRIAYDHVNLTILEGTTKIVSQFSLGFRFPFLFLFSRGAAANKTLKLLSTRLAFTFHWSDRL